ncbi:HalOD1 output domain-containing protein [Halobacterium jilantaiense]|uniref:Halobacterial output domain-containing protein n=1 Tax=Halobacterium jilantaiense TaxID=355548 RepID=A0A1I0Q8T7_9EURY|nr:HalOD1 output domain-containing protein [Halobacterium jilantaiense]SEW23423.1 hypothetical protein SAMN04487945_2389 [Halobacterium jilantaiense]
MVDEPVAPEPGEWRQVTQTRYDPDRDGELGTEIVYAVAETKDADPLDHDELPVLHDTIDAEFLEASVVDSTDVPNTDDSRSHASFEYADCLVTVEHDGWITVYERQ